MDHKAKEVPAKTEPMKGLGKEREHNMKDKSIRKHPHHNLGYKGLSKGKGDGSERTGKMISKKSPARDHVHKNLGYDGITKKIPGANGSERMESAYKKKNPFR
jgi:hypothetical protein